MKRSTIIALALLTALGASFAVAQVAPTTPAKSAITSPPSTPDPAVNLKVPKDSGGKSTSSLIADAPFPNDYVMGKKEAPLVMVEYVSMTCPHCAHFSNAVLPDIEKKYIDTGKLRYVLRQFPLNEPALKAAMLLDCVGEQNKDKYFVFSRVLFDAQNKWAFDGNFLSGLETIATVGGLSKEQFGGCVNNTDREMRVLKNKKMAADDLKVPHTPYIFIGGEVYDGPRTLEDVSAFIDAKLAQIPPAAQ